jgi:hypothetical protein
VGGGRAVKKKGWELLRTYLANKWLGLGSRGNPQEVSKHQNTLRDVTVFNKGRDVNAKS